VPDILDPDESDEGSPDFRRLERGGFRHRLFVLGQSDAYCADGYYYYYY
jgi:hypothetical protein